MSPNQISVLTYCFLKGIRIQFENSGPQHRLYYRENVIKQVLKQNLRILREQCTAKGAS